MSNQMKTLTIDSFSTRSTQTNQVHVFHCRNRVSLYNVTFNIPHKFQLALLQNNIIFTSTLGLEGMTKEDYVRHRISDSKQDRYENKPYLHIVLSKRTSSLLQAPLQRRV
jgi:hypothetical protein